MAQTFLSLHRAIYLFGSLLFLLSLQVSADAVGDLQTKGRTAINAQLAKSKTCNPTSLVVRKEWYVAISHASEVLRG